MYFLGIDGGGTKTEALICNESGWIVGKGISGPSNPLFIAKDAAFENIKMSIDIAVKCCSGDICFNAAAICIPGIKRYRDEVRARFLLNCSNVYIDADELNSFYGALAKPYGVVVLAGTGSFAMGINKKGEKANLGGWGPLIGDEGSGYHIGISCLQSVVREYEGAGRKTSLTPRVKKILNIKEIPELRKVIYAREFDRKTIGDLSRIVKESALEGDAAAMEIVTEAAGYLAELVNRTIKRLQMHDGEYDAVLTGGVSKFGDLIRKPFYELIKNTNMNFNAALPKMVPAAGALMIAMEETGINIYDQCVLNNICNTYHRLEFIY